MSCTSCTTSALRQLHHVRDEQTIVQTVIGRHISPALSEQMRKQGLGKTHKPYSGDNSHTQTPVCVWVGQADGDHQTYLQGPKHGQYGCKCFWVIHV